MLQVVPSLLGGVNPDVELLYYHIEMLRLFENLVFPKPCKCGTYKPVTARFLSCLSGKSPSRMLETTSTLSVAA